MTTRSDSCRHYAHGDDGFPQPAVGTRWLTPRGLLCVVTAVSNQSVWLHYVVSGVSGRANRLTFYRNYLPHTEDEDT